MAGRLYSELTAHMKTLNHLLKNQLYQLVKEAVTKTVEHSIHTSMHTSGPLQYAGL